MTRTAGYVAALVVLLAALVVALLLAGNPGASLLPKGDLW